MRKLTIGIIITLLLVGCAGMNIALNDNAQEVLQDSAVSTIGYLIAKNNPKYIPNLLAWYNKYQNLDEFSDMQLTYQDGVAKLTGMVSDDPYLQLQLRNAMSLIQIEYKGPQIPDELDKYNRAISAFMSGVAAAK